MRWRRRLWLGCRQRGGQGLGARRRYRDGAAGAKALMARVHRVARKRAVVNRELSTAAFDGDRAAIESRGVARETAIDDHGLVGGVQTAENRAAGNVAMVAGEGGI